MANEIGTALLTSLTRSSFDIGNMTKTLADAEVAGPRAILERNQEKTSTELDALKYLKTNLEAFNTYVTDLTSPSLFSQKNATSSNENVVSVSSESSVALASFQIESRQLAQAHTLVANKGFSSPSDTLSVGTLNIETGGQTHAIVVDTSNNTLEGLQSVINNGDYGVTASIINNGGSYQMMFTSKQTGAAGEVALSGLADFDTDGLTVTAEAQDAVMVMNGVTVTSSSNVFDNVIDGMSFTLNSAAPGVQSSVNVGQDSDGVKEAISSFVEVYNQLGSILDELGNYDTSDLTEAELESEEYQYYGDLAGSSLLRSVENQVQQSLRGVLDGFSGGNYRTLADIGVTLNLEGGLDLDSERLDEVIGSNMQAVSDLFSRGGTSDDPLVNVIGGNERTQVGSYDLQITQLAERATFTGGASVVTADERLAGDRITDASAVLTIDVGASFDLTIGALPATTIDLSALAGDYATKDDLAAAIQGQITATLGAGVASFSYDSTQSRFEVTATAGQGSVDITATSAMLNQGFGSTSYAGEALIDLGAVDATFDVSVDGSTASTVTLSAGRYTLDELSETMTNSINNNTDVQASGAGVIVTNDGSALSLTSTRFGIASTVSLANMANMANTGLVANSDVGQNVDGTLTTASGALSIGAYVNGEDGRKVEISDYAVINGNEAEVRGLQFEVLGGLASVLPDPLGEPRGAITFSQGFASQLEDTINNLFASDTGLVSQRIENLTDKTEEYADKAKDIDARYERVLTKYQLQFSMLQSIMSSTEQTRNYLTATFNNNNNN